MPLVEQELLTLPEHLSSPRVLSGVHVTRSLVLYACFVDRCLSFCTFSFGHCVVCSSSIYRFWLPLWYLQTLLPYVSKCKLSHWKRLRITNWTTKPIFSICLCPISNTYSVTRCWFNFPSNILIFNSIC